MSSNIPTFGTAKKCPGSRIPNSVTNTAMKSSIPKPSMIPTTIKKPSNNLSSQNLMNTGIKRPRPPTMNSSNITSTSIATKFKRSTPLSLMKVKTNINNQNETLEYESSINFANKIPQGLNFSESFRTPMPIRHTSSSALIDLSSNDNHDQQHEEIIKKTTESKSTSPIVDWKTITKESEIITLKVQINVLKKELQELQTKNTKLSIENEVNKTKQQNNIDEYMKEINNLKNDLSAKQEQQTKLEYESYEFQRLYLEQVKTNETKSIEYENKLNELNSKISELKSELETSKSTIKLNQMNYDHEIQQLKNENKQLIQENELLRKNIQNIDDKNNEIKDLKNQIENLQNDNRKLSNELKSNEDAKNLQKLFENEMKQYQDMKIENRNLKNKLELLKTFENDNVILREKLLNSETTIKLLNKKLEEKNFDMNQFEIDKKKLLEWTQICGIDSPEIVAENIRNLNEKLSLIQIENELLQSKIKSFEESKQNDSLLLKQKELNEQNLQNKIQELEKQMKKLQEKSLYLQKECEYYKQESMNINNNSNKANDNDQQQKLKEFEQLIEKYRTMINDLEKELKEKNEKLQTYEMNENELIRLRQELKSIKELNPHIFMMNTESLTDEDNNKGDKSVTSAIESLQTNENNYRIMTLKDNPLQWAIQKRNDDMKNLITINERLKYLIEKYEQGEIISTSNQAANQQQQISSSSNQSKSNQIIFNENLQKQIDEDLRYQSKVKELEDKLQRYERQAKTWMEKSKTHIDNFRKCCMETTGYQIDYLRNNRYRLRHKYSFKNEIYIEFDGKNIKLLSNDIVEKLSDKIQLYVTEHKSFPGFFASYTLDLLKEYTMI